MISNFFDNNAIASDLNITPSKQNFKYFKKTNLFKKDFKIYSFKHDITHDFKNKIANFATNVVSE
jgi:hypothetical protein